MTSNYMIVINTRLYIRQFYRIEEDEAIRAVEGYHKMGYCAVRRRSPRNGWAIYKGPKRKR